MMTIRIESKVSLSIQFQVFSKELVEKINFLILNQNML